MLANRGRILAAAESGDRDAFLGLYDQFAPMLYRFSFWLTGNESEARELVIAIFRRAYRAISKRPRNVVLDTWFYRMAVRTYLASARWHRLTRRAPGPVEVEDRTTAWRRATLALPPRLRVVWLLSLAEGMPQSQTAEALGTSLDRVETLLERARSEFRAPDSEADRGSVERAMRQLGAPRPGATLRGEVAAALGTGDSTVRSRVMQVGIALVVLALLISVGFSLLRGPEDTELTPEQVEAQPPTIVLLGVADTGALIAFNPKDLKPSTVTGVGGEPRALAVSADRKTLFILQEEGLLAVDAQSQQVGRLLELPSQDLSSLSVIGQYLVMGSETAASLLVMDENDEVVMEISLPWAVDRLVPLGEDSLLAVAIDRTQMVRVMLGSARVDKAIAIGDGLVIGAIVHAADGVLAYVTTPETEEIWRVALDSGQAMRLATDAAGRATHGVINADGSALFLSSQTGPPPAEPAEDSDSDADVKSRVPPVRTTTKEASDADATADEAAVADELPALTMISTTDGSVERTLWQSGGLTQLTLDPARNALYALAPHASAILVLDSRTLHVRNVVPLAVRPVAFTLVAGPN
ncbi:MAG: RNA polymerase sigma factor [Chloroflexi bacterium]|nr:RNA polymerase sigma factor [Chloroflexota bacterium]